MDPAQTHPARTAPPRPDPPAPLRQWTGELVDPAAERAFRADQLARSAGVLSRTAVVFAASVLGFSAADLGPLGVGAPWLAMAAARLAVAAAIVAVGVTVRRRPDRLAGTGGAWIVTLVEAATLTTLLLACALRPAGTANLDLSAVLLGLAITVVVPGPLRHRAGLTGTFYVAYVAIALTTFPAADIRPAPYAVLFATAWIGGLACAIRLNRVERTAWAALRDERRERTRLAAEVVASDADRRELARRADEDALTGLATRRAFLAASTDALALARHHALPAAAVVIDADRFKAINDRHGHATGDAALRALAAAVTSAVRDGDVVGRMGGEELAVLLPDAPPDVARAVAERVRRAVADATVACPTGTVTLSVSVGVAHAEADEDLDDVLRRADAAMYAAKRAGGNRVGDGDGGGPSGHPRMAGDLAGNTR